MQLETIHFGTPIPERSPLLFIHGAYCGAWVWERHFIPFFESKGWYGIAVSLRGHGQSEGLNTLDMLGIQDFVDDVERVALGFPSPPIVIGHSMGGMIAQLLAVRCPLTAMALLVSVPPHGLASAAQQMWLQAPSFLTQMGAALSLGGWAINPAMVSDKLFSLDTPSWVRSRYLSQFQRESSRAAFEIMIPQLLVPPLPLPPTLVMGGDQDPFIPRREIELTGLFWGTEAHIIPELPHAMMLDERWEQAAEPIAQWLDGL